MTDTTVAGSESLSTLAAVSPGLIVVIVVLGVLELTLAVIALVVLVRTPRQRVTLPKWAWALLIIFINLIGSILFLAIGRRPEPAVDPSAGTTPAEGSAARPSASTVADSLYGGAPARPMAQSENDRAAAPDGTAAPDGAATADGGDQEPR